MESLLLSSESWFCKVLFVPSKPRVTASPSLWKTCNQILLGFKGIPWGFPVLLLGPQAGKPDAGLLVDHPPSGYAILFYHDYVPPTVSLWHLLCLSTWVFLFCKYQHLPLDGCLTASCDFGALTGGDKCISF